MSEKYKKELITIINQFLPNAKIILFGSRARNTHREGADIDLALDVGKKIDLKTLLDIKESIENSTIPLFVDLVDMRSISENLKEEIAKDGRLWTN